MPRVLERRERFRRYSTCAFLRYVLLVMFCAVCEIFGMVSTREPVMDALLVEISMPRAASVKPMNLTVTRTKDMGRISCQSEYILRRPLGGSVW